MRKPNGWQRLQWGFQPCGDDAPDDRCAQIAQTVRKLALSGFLRGIGHVRITHDSHRRIGTRPALFLPEAVDDYVGSDNPVRRSSMPSLTDWTLRRRGFCGWRRKRCEGPGYAPGDLLKLYIYGYLNLVRSSRRLETEGHRNVEILWLLRT